MVKVGEKEVGTDTIEHNVSPYGMVVSLLI